MSVEQFTLAISRRDALAGGSTAHAARANLSAGVPVRSFAPRLSLGINCTCACGTWQTLRIQPIVRLLLELRVARGDVYAAPIDLATAGKFREAVVVVRVGDPEV